MTTFLRTIITLLVAALIQGVASDDKKAGNFTLTRCPDGGDDPGCSKLDEPEVLYPADENEGPGYMNTFRDFIVQYEATHLMAWDKLDDEPMNLTIDLGGYSMQKERSLNFTFRDLAMELVPNSNWTTLRKTFIGPAARSGFMNNMGFEFPSPNSNFSYVSGIRNFYILPSPLYGFVQSGMKKQREIAKEDLTKKWRIGVGVGDGVGVPLLMGLSYFLGTRKSKKKQLSAKEASHE
ncbi:hypothetical protein K4F52_000430 [Lecanicillium sp. MT-2017a]|nr:hypothetical protein K4F52_000430 [Lecanicillium sp. MT-2017a]